ncbi:hypothetical protein CPB85DRAFT_1221175 [Mucidula mucida]|nr:hypothetical protein CPB85DRAFT_1221175 [Mucidula mucida]
MRVFLAHQQKDTAHVVAGLKGAINNPNVSDEAKAQASTRLQEIAGQTQEVGGSEHTNRMLGGYKATLHNDNTSETAKQHAREILAAAGIDVEPASEAERDEHEVRVLAGYKAALHNPRVSSDAKQHAKEYLAARNAL